jgi:hypothetical protein
VSYAIGLRVLPRLLLLHALYDRSHLFFLASLAVSQNLLAFSTPDLLFAF